MRSFQKDYRNGLQNETRCIEFFNYYFDEEFKKTSQQMNPFDFESEKRFIELKSRTCSKNAFETTMIGYDKIYEAKKAGKPVHFAFLFRDGSLWEIEYNAKLFDTFEYSYFKREDRIDHQDIGKTYCYIPVHLLEEIGQV